MELHDYIKVARKRWRIIVAVALVCLGLSALYTAMSPKIYQANTRLFVSTSGDTDAAATGHAAGGRRNAERARHAGRSRAASNERDAGPDAGRRRTNAAFGWTRRRHARPVGNDATGHAVAVAATAGPGRANLLRTEHVVLKT